MAKAAKATRTSERGRVGAEDRGGRVQSLTRALALLNLLAQHEDGMTLTDAARAAGLAPSTAHRLLTTLQHERFVRFDGENARWLVGLQAFSVGSAFLHTRDLGRSARPVLRRLVDETGETANLGVEDDGMAVYLGQVQSRQLMRAIVKPGGRVFMHGSGVGKALLAALPPAEAVRIVRQRGLPVFTPRTITDEARLLRHLEEVRARGFAVDDEEYAVGLRCVAAAVFDEDGAAMGAVSVSGPAVRVTRERVGELGEAVRRGADGLTLDLGGRRAPPRPR